MGDKDIEKSAFGKAVDRIKTFIRGEGYNDSVEGLYKDMQSGSFDYGSVFTKRFNYLRDVQLMLKNPIIGSSVDVLMDTAFQPQADMSIIDVVSDIAVIKTELNEFIDKFNIDDYLLTVGYNLMLYGNMPIQVLFNDKMEFKYFRLIPNFKDVMPFVVGNRTIAYQYKGDMYEPFSFVFGQLMSYKDLGGVFNSSKAPSGQEIQNEFVYAPSYLSKAVRPWRFSEAIKNAMMIMRLDKTQFTRIIRVQTSNVFAKPTIKLMNFYRNVFKKIRRMSFGNSVLDVEKQITGGENELVLPQQGEKGVTIEDLGGDVNVTAMKDLELMNQELFAAMKVPPSYIGFSEEAPSSLGDSAVSRWDERFGRSVKSIQYSSLRVIKDLMIIYLRSKGFDVKPKDFYLKVRSTSTVEDEKRRIGQAVGMQTFNDIITGIDAVGIEYNKPYLVKTLFEDIMGSTGTKIDLDMLLDVSGGDTEGMPVNAKKDVKVLKAGSSLLSKDLKSIIEFQRVAGVFSDAQAKAEIESIDSSAVLIEGIQSSNDMMNKRILYSQFITSEDLYSYVEAEVDCSTEVCKYDIDKSKYKINSKRDKFITLPLSNVNILSDVTELSSFDLTKGQPGVLSSVWWTPDGLYAEGEDLFNLLAMKETGYNDMVVDNLFSIDKSKIKGE
jgi:capsid assembly protein Gp20